MSKRRSRHPGLNRRWLLIVEGPMAEPTAEDHDQRLKLLFKEFFEPFFLCFFPVWAQRFDFAQVEWLDKEVFLAPPHGERRRLDPVRGGLETDRHFQRQ
jgi:hypothetical protein